MAEADPRARETLGASERPPAVRGPGAVLADRYRLTRRIGTGGMGTVWEAHHLLLERTVALKLLTVQSPAIAQRLMLEARVLARVRHPAVVEVYDCGVLPDGTPFLVMERLVGESLANHINRSTLAAPVAARLFATLLEGLAAAHRAGVVHRDLKPDNIFLVETPGGEAQPKILDFGIARMASDNELRQTGAGVLLGTPSYMSPEQFNGLPTDERTDIWGLAATLYEALSGMPPFGDDNLAGVMKRVFETPLPYPRKVTGLDGRLFGVLARGLRKVPAERYATADAMRADLVAWLAMKQSAEQAKRDGGSLSGATPVPRTTPEITAPVLTEIRSTPSNPVLAPPAAVRAPANTLDDVIRKKLSGG